MNDPLEQVSRTEQPEEAEVTEDLEEAPLSMLHGSDADFKSSENYFYAPLLEEMPQLNIPLDLPDLPGTYRSVQLNSKKFCVNSRESFQVAEFTRLSVLYTNKTLLVKFPLIREKYALILTLHPTERLF